jgi:hypothetical protein
MLAGSPAADRRVRDINHQDAHRRLPLPDLGLSRAVLNSLIRDVGCSVTRQFVAGPTGC